MLSRERCARSGLGREAELIAERPAEGFVRAVARLERHRQDVIGAVRQRLRRLGQAAPPHIAHHRPVGRRAEQPRQSEARLAGDIGDVVQRDGAGIVAFDVPKRFCDGIHTGLTLPRPSLPRTPGSALDRSCGKRAPPDGPALAGDHSARRGTGQSNSLNASASRFIVDRMRLRVVPRLIRLLTLLAFLSGMQAVAVPLTAVAIDMNAGAPMPDCNSCNHDAMPAAQCAAVCAFTLVCHRRIHRVRPSIAGHAAAGDRRLARRPLDPAGHCTSSSLARHRPPASAGVSVAFAITRRDTMLSNCIAGVCHGIAAADRGLRRGRRPAGARAFNACAACHSLTPDRHMTGPSLADIWRNRPAPSRDSRAIPRR